MSEQLKARVFFHADGMSFPKEFTFKKVKGGWWECPEHMLAIDPRLRLCITHPWNFGTEYYETAPEHKFEIIATALDKG